MNGLFLFGYFILLIATVKSDVSEILNKERDVARPSKLFEPPRYQDANLNKPVSGDLSRNGAVDTIKNQQKKITSDTTNNNQRYNQLVSLNRNDDKLWINSLPGEADKDYPIYSTPPATGFSCKDRHEGYYADTEARCQVFRVCANTDDTGKGFAFLCPNGTLFNQKYFVCDWYMNVECSESENFYYKNDELGKTPNMSFNEMMKAVQKMLDYPKNNYNNNIKSNTNPPFDVRFTDNNRKPNAGFNNNNNNVNTNPNNGRVGQVQGKPNVQFTNNQQQRPVSTNQPNRNQNVNNYQGNAVPVRNNANNQQQFPSRVAPVPGEVYVSSLGQLSSDPESGFDPKTAYIIGGGGGGSVEPFLFKSSPPGQSNNRGQPQQTNFPNNDPASKQIYTYPTTLNGKNEPPVIEEYKTTVISSGGNGVLVGRPQYKIIPSIEESFYTAPNPDFSKPAQPNNNANVKHYSGELNSRLFPQQHYVYNKPPNSLNIQTQNYNTALYRAPVVNNPPSQQNYPQPNYPQQNYQQQNYNRQPAPQPQYQPQPQQQPHHHHQQQQQQYVNQDQVNYLPPPLVQNNNRRVQNIPATLPSVVQNFQPGKKAKVIKTQPAKISNDKVIVDIVPAIGYYWNNPDERRSYFEAVSQGLLDNNGNVYVNNIKKANRRNKNDGRQQHHHQYQQHHQQPSQLYQYPVPHHNQPQPIEPQNSRYNGFSSYNVPLGSIGPLR